jgi:predicted acetyltransferase
MSIELLTIDNLPEYVNLQIAAYPSMGAGTKEFVEKQIKLWEKAMDNNVLLYGHFDGTKMTGCMAIYPFSMNYLNNYLSASGVGSVAVHPLHKKEKTCLKMMKHAMQKAYTEDAYFTILYPFRPDFYRRMGFGLGPTTFQYSWKPSQLKNVLEEVSSENGRLVQLNKDDFLKVVEFHNEVFKTHHGYVKRTEHELKKFLSIVAIKVVAFVQDERITGLMLYASKSLSKENFLENKMVVYEFHTLNIVAKKALWEFCYKQSDQYSQIEYVTQDESMPFLLEDSRSTEHSLLNPTLHHHSANAGYGLMYAALHPEKIIPLLPISQSPTGFEGKSIAFVIQDPFTKEDKIYQYQILHNELIPTDRVLSSETIQFSMANFSSLCTGSLPFEPAYKNGLVKLSNPSWFSFFKALFNIPKPTYNVNF